MTEKKREEVLLQGYPFSDSTKKLVSAAQKEIESRYQVSHKIQNPLELAETLYHMQKYSVIGEVSKSGGRVARFEAEDLVETATAINALLNLSSEKSLVAPIFPKFDKVTSHELDAEKTAVELRMAHYLPKKYSTEVYKDALRLCRNELAKRPGFSDKDFERAVNFYFTELITPSGTNQRERVKPSIVAEDVAKIFEAMIDNRPLYLPFYLCFTSSSSPTRTGFPSAAIGLGAAEMLRSLCQISKNAETY